MFLRDTVDERRVLLAESLGAAKLPKVCCQWLASDFLVIIRKKQSNWGVESKLFLNNFAQ